MSLLHARWRVPAALAVGAIVVTAPSCFCTVEWVEQVPRCED